MSDKNYFTVVYVLKDGQHPSNILKDLTIGEDFIFASVGDCTQCDEDEDEG